MLDNRVGTFNKESFLEDLKNTIDRLDQKNSIERKIKFLLDVRGYYKVNQIKGSYVEFGSYESKMHYAAYDILNKTDAFNKFIGLDTFEGEPSFDSIDTDNTFETEGDFDCDYNNVLSFVNENFGDKGYLIKGDFRSNRVVGELRDRLSGGGINLAVIDCNLLSSFKSALDTSLKYLNSGGIIFLDDVYTNMSNGKSVIYDTFIKEVRFKKGCRLIEHGFYPPFAKSFIIIKEGF